MARHDTSRPLSGALPAGAPGARGQVSPAVTIGAVVLAAAAAAWFLAGFVVARAAVTRLPAVPDTADVAPAAAAAITAADAAARSRPTSSTVGDLALTYQASLRPSEALQALDVAGALDPSDWRWPYYRGLILVERGDHAAAGDAFRAVPAAAAAYGLAQFHLAEMAFKAGRREDAEAAYLAAQSAPAPPPVVTDAGLPPRRARPLAEYAGVGLSRLRLDRGEVEPVRAVDDGRAYVPPADPWLDAVVTRSWHPDLLLKHAALAARAGDAAWRQWLALRALEASPNGLDVLLEVAAMHQAAGRHTEALGYLRQAEAVAPNDHHTLVEQGKTLSELGQLAEAETVLRRAVRVRDAAAEYNLGTVLDQQDRWSEAREHYERALEIDPFHARAMNNLAIGFGARGDLPRALALYRRAIAAAPDDVDSFTNLGGALVGQGRFSEALAALDTAVRLAPGAADAHNNRGIALAQLGRRAEARAAFDTAVRLAPQHGDARRNLAALGPP